MQSGILLAAAGSADTEARAVLGRFEERVRERFSGLPVRWAYTAGVVRERMKRAGLEADAPAEALSRMRAEGILRVAVGSLHVIAGMEYDELKEAANASGRDHRARVVVGKPLLASYEDLGRAARALLAGLPPRTRADECVILIGHGNKRHPADLAYVAAAHVLRELDSRVFLGTVSGSPDLKEVAARCVALGVRKAYLVPFTTLAGRTAREEMTSERPDTLRGALALTGIESEVILKGLLECPDISTLWMDHLGEAVRMLMRPDEEDGPVAS